MDILWYHIRVWQVVGWLQCETWNYQCTFFTVTLKSMSLSYSLNESLTYAWFCNIRHTIWKIVAHCVTHLSSVLRCLEFYPPLLFTISADVNQVEKVDNVLVFLWNSFNLMYSLKWSQELLPICSSRKADHILRTTDTCYPDSLFMRGRK